MISVLVSKAVDRGFFGGGLAFLSRKQICHFYQEVYSLIFRNILKFCHSPTTTVQVFHCHSPPTTEQVLE
jgi:hypothetical protein